ncbi:MAG: sulfur carrier protein ThiS [Clostridia bacterium]|nr:sulfur carrier protein ThiS [Clostridia bacterium]
MVKINGEIKDCAGETVADYLGDNRYSCARVAVEINGDIVPKAKYADTVFRDGDSVEIVAFVGGG